MPGTWFGSSWNFISQLPGNQHLAFIDNPEITIPDLIALPPGSKVLFSEIKTPKGKLSALQKYRLKELEQYGFETEIFRGT